MSYKIFPYDITDYKLFEEKLNELSSNGWNPIEMGYISSFEKNDKHYFYTVDILREEKTNPKKLVKNHLITLYDRYDYRYVGSYSNMIFFRSESKRKLPKGREEIRKNYLETAWVSRLVWMLVMFVALVFSSIYVLYQNDVRHLLTDGEILLQCIIPLLCLGGIFFNLSTALKSFQYKAKKDITRTPFKFIGMFVFIIVLVCVIGGMILDYTERGTKPIDDTILTLEVLGEKTGKPGEYSYSNSKVVHAKSYLDVNDKQDMIFSVVYEVEKNEETYFETFKQEYLKEDEYEKVDKDVFIYSIETENDSMIALVDHKILEITSTFDLMENKNYEKILNFFKEN